MDERREQLLDELERYYRSCGWKVERGPDGTVRAAGAGGVTWIGLAVVESDLADESFAARLLDLSEQRMPRGELCPLELLPDEPVASALRELLSGLRLSERGHVEVYSLAA
jgi:hypothetical protein